jgi:RNA polymerase sigma factor (sigma-70 family)
LSSAAQEKIMELNNHEEAFIQSYSRLRGWAIQIARPDQELAEDLLHDAFIQFTRTQPELKNIDNTDAYLYGVIRNLHLSHLRKKIRREKYSHSIIDFETINLGLKNGDFLDNFQVQEELKRICYFLCLRKETSKSASVMMLRFFHGYFPSEISRVMCANMQVVKVRLNTARNEIKSVIESNEAIQTIENRVSPELILKKSFRNNVDLTIALREMIFRSTDGNCLDDLALREVYLKKETIETGTLAHIVSCRKCIDKVNELLNLLPISERYSVDFIGKDGGGSPGNPTGNGGGMNEDLNEKVLQNWQRGSQEVFEHEPRKLFFSINGDVKTAQNIENNSTEITVKTNQDEPLEFIEIFSEQNIRLAFLSFAEDSPETEREYSFEFSEDRNLSLNLKRENSQIFLTAIYNDPQFEKINLPADCEPEDLSFADFLKVQTTTNKEPELFGGLLDSQKKNSFIEKIRHAFFPSFVGFKSAIAGGSLAALVIAAILFAKLFVFVPNVSAIEIIQKAGNTEQTDENNPEQTVHRVLDLEEKNANGEIVKKRKIEYWNDAVRKLSIKRLFDENNRLIAGEWRRKDGVSTIYSVGKVSELKFAQTDKDIIAKDLENIWQLSVSAKGFESIIDAPENISVKEISDDYQINYSPNIEKEITKAVLFINQNLRTDKLILTVKQNDSQREFSFTETIFEQKPRETVENAVFEPNAELVKNSITAVKNISKPESETGQIDNPATESASKETSPTESVSTSSAVTPENEVKVLQLLNSVNALSGDQINISKTADGKLQIKGIVDSKSRRDEILSALAEVRGNSAISVNIQTPEEATKNKPSKNGNTVLESISVESKNSIPAGDLLRNHFSAQGLSEDKIESEIRRFASAALSKSSQIRRSALQMKQIAERFSVSELEKMDEATRNNWRKLIKQNAASLAQSSESLRNDLRSSVGIDAGSSGENINSANDADLIKAAKKLFELSLAIDRDIRASFSSSGAGKNNVPVKSGTFGGNLSEIIGLAKQIR